MRVNPFYDSWLFLIGETGSHLGVGAWRYLLVLLFWALVIASIFIAYRNWQADPAQRTQVHLGTWAARVAIGTMWFEGSLWKLPIPSGGSSINTPSRLTTMGAPPVTALICPTIEAATS